MSKVITRFPPSPTGNFHVGSARTALFNFLYAVKEGGEMILRFEDTDEKRSKKEFEKDIMKGLDWLSIKYNFQGRQSERTEIYKKNLENLLEKGSAYEAEESKDTGEKANSPSGERQRVIRFKNPNKKITFNDKVRGEVTFDTTELGDFVIAKGRSFPLYHLAVVVDDIDMGVTDIIRGEDHISNTPRQILIFEALSAQVPTYSHLPLLLGEDKKKLSKRHGALSVNEYKELGYLPEALVNFLALLGWNPGDEREIFTMDELIDEFSIERVGKSGAVFSKQKLNDINKHYIKNLSAEEFKEGILGPIPENIKEKPLYNQDVLDKIIPLIQERSTNREDAQKELSNLSFFFKRPSLDGDKVGWKDTQPETTAEHLDAIINKLEDLPEKSFSEESSKEKVWPYAEEKGRGKVLWPMRYALSGAERSPDPFQIAGILGKTETIARLKEAVEILKSKT